MIFVIVLCVDVLKGGKSNMKRWHDLQSTSTVKDDDVDSIIWASIGGHVNLVEFLLSKGF
jgi:hypothetical protein